MSDASRGRSNNPLAPFLKFLRLEGAIGLPHAGRPYAAHLVGVYRMLHSWGFPQEVAAAGFFHSIYGTERFRGWSLPAGRRADVRRMTGRRAEALAFANCALVREEFDLAVKGPPPYRLSNRIEGGTMTLDGPDATDLCAIHLCDWVEQLPWVDDWSYRREGYLSLASRLGAPAADALLRAYEPHMSPKDPLVAPPALGRPP